MTTQTKPIMSIARRRYLAALRKANDDFKLEAPVEELVYAQIMAKVVRAAHDANDIVRTVSTIDRPHRVAFLMNTVPTMDPAVGYLVAALLKEHLPDLLEEFTDERRRPVPRAAITA